MDSKDRQIQELTSLVTKLLTRIESLESELVRYRTPKNSSNSSVPPSKDENRPQKNKSLRKASGKKTGGQQGHKGHTLEMSTSPDEVIGYTPAFCNGCGNSLEHLPSRLKTRRQQIDIPTPKAIITEHQSYQKTCQCGHTTISQLPSHLTAPIQYGSSVEAMIGYLHTRQYLPYQRLSETLATCFGIKISQGSIDNIIGRVSQKAQGIYQRIQQQISQQSVVGSDETGVKINGKKNWIWTWQNNKYTYITVSPSRGFTVIDTTFPQGFPNTTLCHDAWRAQLKCEAKAHQLCIAHLLRDLNYLEERYPKHGWASQCKQVFFDSMALKRELLPQAYLDENPKRSVLEKRLDRLLDQIIDKKHQQIVTLQKRLKKYRAHLLVFLYQYDVPPDNNGAERAIRNVKVKSKISGQFRSFRGAQNFVILRSVIDTLIKQSQQILPNLQAIATS
ncbi:MAG: IS66 family transposase [Cyclobacteriaceae bacterium]